MSEKVKKILTVIFFPVLFLVGLMVGRNLTGSAKRSGAGEEASKQLAAADELATRAGDLVKQLRSELDKTVTDTAASRDQVNRAAGIATECTDLIKQLGSEIGRAREAGADCRSILGEYSRLADENGRIIEELLRRAASSDEKSEEAELDVDSSDCIDDIFGGSSPGV